MKTVVAFSAALFAVACQPTPAVISEIGDDALTIQSSTTTTGADVLATAAEGCALYGKEPVRISTQCHDVYCTRRETLFACR